MKTRVAIVQSSPVFMNVEASLQKLARLVEAAAKDGALLVVVGETWLPGYPAWLDFCPEAALWDHAPTKEVFARLRNERVESGPGNGTLYNALLTFTSDGELANHHRKLVPTFTERLVWGQGEGAGLHSIPTSAAGRVGGLICWEHWMPLARHALHFAGEQIHVAVWPTVHEMHQLASRHYAFEGRCFVLAAGLIMQAKDLPNELSASPQFANDPEAFVLRGGSAIIGPDGKYVVEPVFDRETTITAELDFTMIDREKMTLDVAGHYSRPDVFDITVRDGARG